MRLSTLGFLGCLLIVGVLHAQDDPETLVREGQDAFRQSETDPNAIVTAATKFTAALEIYEQRKDDSACTKLNSFLFWCRRRMSDKNINDFLRDTKTASVATRLEGTKKPVPATDAKAYFDRAEKFAAENPNDSLSIAALYFEVAERFIGTPLSLDAQRKSLDYQQRAFKAMGDKPNKAPPQKAIAVAPGQRLPVPDANAQKAAEKIIKEVFKEDYAALAKATPDEKYAFSQKLLKQASESKDDKAAQYVLWKEANTMAAQSGKIDLALSVADQIGQVFEINASELRKKTLQAALWATRDRELLDAMSAMVTLEDKPNDGDANLVVGKYYCFQKDDWTKGLPFLSKGSEPTLRNLAEADLAGPSDASAQAAVGDGWWDLEEAETGKHQKSLLQERVRFWYEKALASLDGLAKAKVEKRLSDIKRIVNLLSMPNCRIQGGHKGIGTAEFRSGELIMSAIDDTAHVFFPYRPPAEYDVRMVLTRTKDNPKRLLSDIGINLSVDENGYMHGFRNEELDGSTSVGFWSPKKLEDTKKAEFQLGKSRVSTNLKDGIKKGKKVTVLIQVRKGSIATLIDGQQVLMCTSLSEARTYPLETTIFVWNNKTVFHTLEVIEVTGKGEITTPSASKVNGVDTNLK